MSNNKIKVFLLVIPLAGLVAGILVHDELARMKRPCEDYWLVPRDRILLYSRNEDCSRIVPVGFLSSGAKVRVRDRVWQKEGYIAHYWKVEAQNNSIAYVMDNDNYVIDQSSRATASEGECPALPEDIAIRFAVQETFKADYQVREDAALIALRTKTAKVIDSLFDLAMLRSERGEKLMFQLYQDALKVDMKSDIATALIRMHRKEAIRFLVDSVRQNATRGIVDLNAAGALGEGRIVDALPDLRKVCRDFSPRNREEVAKLAMLERIVAELEYFEKSQTNLYPNQACANRNENKRPGFFKRTLVKMWRMSGG